MTEKTQQMEISTKSNIASSIRSSSSDIQRKNISNNKMGKAKTTQPIMTNLKLLNTDDRYSNIPIYTV